MLLIIPDSVPIMAPGNCFCVSSSGVTSNNFFFVMRVANCADMTASISRL